MPERHEQPSGRTVELAVAIVRSPTARPDAEPVVYLEGGPGGSALSGVEAWTDPPSPLLADRDVVLIDQRGTGYSTPRLSCDDDFAATPGADTAPIGPPAPDDPILVATAACADRLRSEGIDLDAYDTAQSAADVAALRPALGIQRWHLFGVSYGTRLALRVMRDHPDGIDGVVLDSVYPAGVAPPEEGPAIAADAMAGLFARCRADQRCDAAFGDLERRFHDTVARLDATPVTTTLDDPETGEPTEYDLRGVDLVNAVFDALYVTRALPNLPRAIDLATRGRYAEAFDLFGVEAPTTGAPVPAAAPPPADERPDDSDGLYLSVECAESMPGSTEASIRRRAEAVPEAIRGDLVDESLSELAQCRAWPVRAEVAATTSSDRPVLVLAGGLDPVTPVAWAEQAAKTLPRATVRSFPDAGHAVIDAGPCPQQLIVDFLRDPGGPVAQCRAEPLRFVTS